MREVGEHKIMKNGYSELHLRVTYSQDKLLNILIGRKEDLAKIATSAPLPVNSSNLNIEYECESNRNIALRSEEVRKVSTKQIKSNSSESMISSKSGILFLRLCAFTKKHFIEEVLT